MVANEATVDSQSQELENHKDAYTLLFDSLLKKRVTDVSAQQAVRSELDRVVQSIETIDAFLDHISDFARILKLRDDQLGAYIGQNFLKALSAVQENPRAEKQKAKPVVGDAFIQDLPIISTIVATFGTIVNAPDRFVPYEDGLIQLLKNGKSILPRSTAPADNDTGVAATIENTEADTADDSLPKADQPESQPVAEAITYRQEKSILAEILETFGNVLDVHDILVPKSYSNEDDDFVVEPVVVAPKEEVSYEPSILDEICTRFGNDLNVTAKLEPKEYSGDGEFFEASEADEADGDSDVSDFIQIEPITFLFTDCAAVRTRLTSFQKNQDRTGYQSYLTDASDETKAVVGLINLRSKAGGQPLSNDDIERLSMRLPFSVDQLTELSERVGRYQKMAGLVNEFMVKVKHASPTLQTEVKKIWKQFLDLIDADSGEVVTKQRVKVILLAVHPSVKANVESGIMSLISRIYSL